MRSETIFYLLLVVSALSVLAMVADVVLKMREQDPLRKETPVIHFKAGENGIELAFDSLADIDAMIELLKEKRKEFTPAPEILPFKQPITKPLMPGQIAPRD